MSLSRIAISGAAGRMGRALLREVLSTPETTVAGGLEAPGSSNLGKDLGVLAGLDGIGLQVSDTPATVLTGSDVLIDFTVPAATVSVAAAAKGHNVPLVIGTTGFSDEQQAELEALARTIPIVQSGNMSLGVNFLLSLVHQAAKNLGADFDIEVIEAHHRRKIDAPSGTALMLGEAAAEGRGLDLSAAQVTDRSTIRQARRSDEIGMSVVRGGGIIGRHEVMFASDSEVITLSHEALDRSLFAKGAVRAARWAIGKDPGLYSMGDVLGLKESQK
ncbi:MAG: 4-hydroxy-tetrahydrodipicolinate reductase [Pseudomonadota bacterium]